MAVKHFLAFYPQSDYNKREGEIRSFQIIRRHALTGDRRADRIQNRKGDNHESKSYNDSVPGFEGDFGP